MSGDGGNAPGPRLYEPYRPPYFTLTVRALLNGLFAAFWLVLWLILLSDAVYMSVRGQETTATVVSVEGHRVTVHLPAPVDRSIPLGEWSNPPHVGDVFPVVYDPADPTHVERLDFGSWVIRVIFLFPSAGLTIRCWWAGTKPWRQARRTELRSRIAESPPD